jgi:hypothetical protein
MTRLLGPLALVLALTLALASPPAWAQAFLSVSDDVPLMPGLTEDADAALVFDTPDGRIVEAAAVGAVAASDVLDFYAATLPQLGWTRAAQGRYARDAETLTLEFADTAGRTLVRFRFAPTP